jgi:hypothetical protein
MLVRVEASVLTSRTADETLFIFIPPGYSPNCEKKKTFQPDLIKFAIVAQAQVMKREEGGARKWATRENGERKEGGVTLWGEAGGATSSTSRE